MDTAIDFRRLTGGDVFRSDGAQATFDFGFAFGKMLRGGEVITLDGGLGAGKTVLTKGLAAALGVDPDDVHSPTFTLVNCYDGGRLTLFHLDLYRLEGGPYAAAAAVDLDEIVADQSAIVVIEWGGRLADYPLPRPLWRIKIKDDGDYARTIGVTHHAD